jgi:hypothetical protein
MRSLHKLCKRKVRHTQTFFRKNITPVNTMKKRRLVRMFRIKIFRFMEAHLSFFLFKKTHLHIENQLSTYFKTDFTASHFLQVVLSVATLLFEIAFSKFVRNKILNKNPKNKSEIIYKFSYKSKCTDVKNAMRQLNLLHNILLGEDDLEITYPQVAKKPSDNAFEILISWEFNVNNLEMLDKIIFKFDEFTDFLDTMSF